MRIFVLILVAILMCAPSKGFSKESFYKGHARGWHWYETKKVNNEKSNNPRVDGGNQVDSSTPTQKIENIRKKAQELLHLAMIKPTEKNIMEYMKMQEEIADRSEEFSRVWQNVVYKNPNLDRTLQHPVSYNALHISKEERSEASRRKIKSLSQEYGLMYFFRGDCKYCQGFASVVLSFANKYEWDLMPVQIGEVGIEGLENAKRDNGVSARLGIKAVPALIAVHPKTGDMIPLAFGYISESEIEERVDALVANKGMVREARELIRSQGR